MISVATARQIIKEKVVPLPVVQVNLGGAGGLVLAASVFSPLDMPFFEQSSMDGYAFSFKEWKTGGELIISGESAAGSAATDTIQPGQAVRIFTGAPVPPGTDTVVMQEKVTVYENRLQINDELLKQGGNVRPRGSEIKQGELALEAGTLLTPAAIGFLAGIGITEITAFPKPRVTIIVTGKELQQPGLPLAPGQIYESNAATLTAALAELRIMVSKVFWADDDLAELTSILGEALLTSDVVLLSGGVSVGDYDFVLRAAANCLIEQQFHRIKQKPGKPLFFGKKSNQLVFGLPGNPSSVLTCFYQYVLPALNQLASRYTGLQKLLVPLATAYEKPAGITHFLKGRYDGKIVSIMSAQESYRLSSFALANCLVELEEDITKLAAGTPVSIHLFKCV